MDIVDTPISGLFVVKTEPFLDSRGSFTRFFCENDLSTVLDGRRIVQMNHSRTEIAGSVRGLHYQKPPHAEMKAVRCIRGRIWDVAVDLRADSPTFLSWHAEELTPGNTRMLVIPEGFAHGFQVLEPGSEILYLVTASYARHAEGAVAHNDPRLAISWPLAPTELSQRDRETPWLADDFKGIQL